MVCGASKVVLVGTPCSRAAPITKGLKVDPGWKPSMPPYWVDTLTFCQVSPSPLPSLVRLWAMAVIRPVLGWISTDPPQTGSLAPTVWETAASAACWASGSMRVLMVRPPRLSRFVRSSVVDPSEGI